MTPSPLVPMILALSAATQSGVASSIPGSIPTASPLPARPDTDEGARWIHAADDLTWVPMEITGGEEGAVAVAEVERSEPYLFLFAGGPVSPVSASYREADSLLSLRLAGHEEAPVAAALGTVLCNPPLWQFSFDPQSWDTGGGVLVSRYAEVVLSWWHERGVGGLRVEAFRPDGSRISSGALVDASWMYGLRDVQISDDGSRALFFDGSRLFLYDVLRGETELVHSDRQISGGHALSGDGRRFVSASRHAIQVLEWSEEAAWQVALSVALDAADYPQHVALNREGTRLAILTFGRDRSDLVQVRLHDVDTERVLSEHSCTVPGVVGQRLPSNVRLDEAGRVLAELCTGDELDRTPEVFVLGG